MTVSTNMAVKRPRLRCLDKAPISKSEAVPADRPSYDHNSHRHLNRKGGGDPVNHKLHRKRSKQHAEQP